MSQAAPDLKQLYEAVLNGDAKTAVEVTKGALAAGVDPQQLVTEQMIPAMDEVGRRFENNEYFVPELLIAAGDERCVRFTSTTVGRAGIQPVGRVVIGTVKGDLHDIGKGLVAAMLEGGGFEVVDLGVDVPPEKFVAQAQENNANDHCGVRIAHHHDDRHEDGRSGRARIGIAGSVQGDRRRGTRDPAIRRHDRGGRLQQQRRGGRRPRTANGCNLTSLSCRTRQESVTPHAVSPRGQRPARL